MKLRAALLASLIVLPSCTTQQTDKSGEIFDEETALTELVSAKPLVFARDRSDVAAHARDYATLVAVEVDRSGEYGEYLLLYRWSTVDRRMSPPPPRDAGRLRLLADGREIDLTPLDRIPVNMQQPRALHIPPHGDIVAHAYKVDTALLQFIAASRDIVLRMPQESLDTPFPLWADGRASLQRFLERAAPP